MEEENQRVKGEAPFRPPAADGEGRVEEASDHSVGGSTPPLPLSRGFSSSERRTLCLELKRTVESQESQEQQSVLLCFPCRANEVGILLPLPMQCKCIASRSMGLTLQEFHGEMSELSASISEQWTTGLTDRECTHEVVAAQKAIHFARSLVAKEKGVATA